MAKMSACTKKSALVGVVGVVAVVVAYVLGKKQGTKEGSQGTSGLFR